MLALVAFAGALILEIILTFATGLNIAFTAREIPTHLAALLVGSLAGFLFELLRQMTEAANRTMRKATDLQIGIQALTAKITYQDEALEMLNSCPRHNEALTSLIKASMADNFKVIPFVGVSSYLEFLKKAVDHSDGYEGIQRNPLSWYKETGAGSYLSDLKRRHMSCKKRLLIIDESDELQMKADLEDADTLEYYWGHTGAVTTYWIKAADLKAKLPRLEIPEDLALYDRQLLIKFNETTQILTFDVIDAEHSIRRLLDAVDGLKSYGFEFLHELPMPDHVRQ